MLPVRARVSHSWHRLTALCRERCRRSIRQLTCGPPMATLVCEPVATRRGRSVRQWVWAARLECLSLNRPVAARRSSAIGWVCPIMRALPCSRWQDDERRHTMLRSHGVLRPFPRRSGFRSGRRALRCPGLVASPLTRRPQGPGKGERSRSGSSPTPCGPMRCAETSSSSGMCFVLISSARNLASCFVV